MHVVRRRFEENPRKPKGEIYAEVGADFALSAMSIRLRYSQWRQGGDEALRPKTPGPAGAWETGVCSPRARSVTLR